MLEKMPRQSHVWISLYNKTVIFVCNIVWKWFDENLNLISILILYFVIFIYNENAVK